MDPSENQQLPLSTFADARRRMDPVLEYRPEPMSYDDDLQFGMDEDAQELFNFSSEDESTSPRHSESADSSDSLAARTQSDEGQDTEDTEITSLTRGMEKKCGIAIPKIGSRSCPVANALASVDEDIEEMFNRGKPPSEITKRQDEKRRETQGLSYGHSPGKNRQGTGL